LGNALQGLLTCDESAQHIETQGFYLAQFHSAERPPGYLNQSNSFDVEATAWQAVFRWLPGQLFV
jgi:hypothetical protein